MNSIHLAWLCLLICSFPAAAGNESSGYFQSYAILIRGVPAGSETVTETIDESGNLISASDHELIISDGLETKRTTFSTKMVLDKNSWTPISYTYKYTTGTTGDSYEVMVKDGAVTRTLNRGGRSDEVHAPVPLNMVIVDYNVYHHFDYVVRKYDMTKGGRQLFADFIPLIGDNIPLALTFLGNADLASEKESIRAGNYKIEFVGLWSGNLFVDANGRLLRLFLPAQDLEIVRKDLLVSSDPNKE
ncbi:MAG: hypothetical protein JXA73_02795 [Acidobacteria bacterium]|nr:hypothetical protein [Acidobacteriota bacterium]